VSDPLPRASAPPEPPVAAPGGAPQAGAGTDAATSRAAAWLGAYAAAWRAADPRAAAALFAHDARYTADPFGPGLRGREQIAAYWAQATAAQSGLDLHVEAPVADGDRAAAAWRATFVRDGERVELAACLLLRFDADGRCTDLREFWRQAEHSEPHP
jgi:ketosteroid isomerase-like protein